MKKIRICINGMTENEQIRGPVRYIYEIINNLSVVDLDVYLIAGNWQKQVYESLEKKVKVLYYDINRSKVFRALFFVFFVPLVLKKYSIDLYHLPDTNPLPLFRNNIKVVSTIHDCAEFVVPNRYSFIQAIYRRIISKYQAHYSDIVITVSNSSKQDIIDNLSISHEKIIVIYNGVSTFKHENSVENIKDDVVDSRPIKYILYVGVIEKAKNVDLLVKAYADLPEKLRADVSLVLVGRKGNAYEEVVAIIEKENLQENVAFYGYLSDKQLAIIYKNALIFAYVSEYEGFGLPVLESMALGIPVLTSNKSSMKEIAENAAILADTCVDDVQKKLQMLLANEELRGECIKKGFELIKKFEWKKASNETCNVYRTLVNSN